MERTQMDPSVTIASVNLPTPKMKILATSPVAPIHRKAKLLTRCLLKGAVAAANPLALLLMVEDEMRYGAGVALACWLSGSGFSPSVSQHFRKCSGAGQAARLAEQLGTDQTGTLDCETPGEETL